MPENPPAFPLPPVGTGDPRDGMAGGTPGMTLRDYFAAAALPPALDVRPASIWQCVRWFFGWPYRGCEPAPKEAARLAYAMADAMLAERAKGLEATQ